MSGRDLVGWKWQMNLALKLVKNEVVRVGTRGRRIFFILLFFPLTFCFLGPPSITPQKPIADGREIHTITTRLAV
ncbi:hypothetical protein BDV32DRAFT_133841 [Aspergillus pseudonomiae]|uniref:Uncharacterized protein n=1 Tax=Aspergillus pseudonomiae TaxID=1506151 RepID=A0A5N6HJY1_9EURO|nr:uncharacterized protein BDV37DRAFT_258676 [Aspergillus pseudonomiae]KAB8253620.1 hypothetical protein BDV32DRAFT_133841 [Aspergillus pseudonomiae]KAE8400011.1 hypothetical protein BDV37DRAFT_258676 [Aspergillus pseudonomiae]